MQIKLNLVAVKFTSKLPISIFFLIFIGIILVLKERRKLKLLCYIVLIITIGTYSTRLQPTIKVSYRNIIGIR